MFRKLSLGLMLSAVVLASGCQSTSKNPIPNESDALLGTVSVSEIATVLGVYKLKPLDPIYVRFSGIMEQQQLELVIDENGEISLLHIREAIKASGLTTSELEEKIEHLYMAGEIYKNISINITMTAKIYYLQGEVNQPGQFQLTSGTTLLQAIAGARGYTAFANKKKVTITRAGKIFIYNIKKLEKDPTKDVKIEAGDVIKVWQQWY